MMDYKKEYFDLKLKYVKLQKEMLELKANEQRAARELIECRSFEADGTLTKAE